jgi:hypothetical protein
MPSNYDSKSYHFPNGKFSFTQIFRAFLIILACFGIIEVTFVAVSRMFYPFDLEWIEGVTVELVKRLTEGESIYCSPTVEYIPMVYTPLYHYLGAFVSKVFGVGFVPLRAISFVSFLLTLFVLYKIIFDVTKDRFWSLVGIGLYSFSFAFCGFWFDLARIDTFANFMLIVSFYFLLREKSFAIFLSALFSFFAFYSKQSNLIVTIFLFFPLLLEDKKRALIFLAYYLSFVIVSTLVENYFTNGWYMFWNFFAPMSHQWEWSRLVTFWTTDVVPSYPVFFVLLGFWLVKSHNINDFPKSKYFLFFLAGTILNSYFFRLHQGGFLNVLIPLATSISVLLPIFLDWFAQNFNTPNNYRNATYVFVLVQFIVLVYNPFLQIPRKIDEKIGWEFIRKIKDIEGEVFIPGHSFISRYAGKKSFTHYVRINEFLESKSKESEDFYKEFLRTLREHKFSAIILDSDILLPEIAQNYYKSGQIIEGNGFYTVIGKSRPQDLWLPIK